MKMKTRNKSGKLEPVAEQPGYSSPVVEPPDPAVLADVVKRLLPNNPNDGKTRGTALKTKGKKKSGKPDPVIVAYIVERIVRAVNPEKIVLFGSAARGTMGPDSDYDFLVIKGGKFNKHRVSVAIYREIRGKGAAADIVVVTPEEVELYRDTHCLVICPALKEGRVVYDALASAAERSA